MRIPLIILPALLTFGFPALAAADEADAQNAFTRLNQCMRQGNKDCSSLITARSATLYSRFVTDGLMPCVPKDAAYISQDTADGEIIVRAGTKANGKLRIMRLHFAQEQGAWKLDIPATLQAGMGDNWQQKVDMTEQLYLALRQQMGGQLNCSMIRSMIKK